jgi:hypothetical protein
VSQLQAQYLYHVVKQGKAQPSYDAQLVEEVVQSMAGLGLGRPLRWEQELLVEHN